MLRARADPVWWVIRSTGRLCSVSVIPSLARRLGTNRLAVSAPATLLTHAGNGHQLKLNKAASGDTASLLYQTNWSGRAEMGLTGDDHFRLKVSADGAAWTDALTVDAGTRHKSAKDVE